MKTKTILIQIKIGESNIATALNLRHVLVDTIESRTWGEVVEETSSLNLLEVVIEVPFKKDINHQLTNLLESLGFGDFCIQNISVDEE